MRILNLDGSVTFDETAPVAAAPPSHAAELRTLPAPAGLSPVHLVRLDLLDANNRVVSDNFYWKESNQDDLTALDSIPDVELEGRIVRRDAGGKCLLDVTLSNPTRDIAVMAHLQLRNPRTNRRVLPVYLFRELRLAASRREPHDDYRSILGGPGRNAPARRGRRLERHGQSHGLSRRRRFSDCYQ